MVAEERKWRLKMDALQERQSKEEARLEAVDKHLGELAARVGAHDADARRTYTVLQKAERDLEAAGGEREALRAAVEAGLEAMHGCVSRVERLEASLLVSAKAARQLAQQVASLEDRMQSSCATAEEMAVSCDRQIKEARSVLDSRCDVLSKDILALDFRVVSAEQERLAELRVVCEKLDVQGHDIDQLQAMKGEVQRHVDMALSGKASAAELETALNTLRDWTAEAGEALKSWAHQAHRVTAAEIERARTCNAEHSIALRRHDMWMNRLAQFCEQIRVREQGLSHVLLHVVEQSAPEQLKLFEAALRVPQFTHD